LLTYDEPTWTAWAAVAAYALALFSKEVAIVGVVLLPLMDLVRGRPLRRNLAAGFIVVTMIYLALREAALGATITGTAGTQPILASLLGAIGYYIKMLLVPVGLRAYIPELPDGAALPAVGLLVVAVAVGGAIVSAQRGDRTTAWLIAWFFATLAPSLVVIVRKVAQAPVAERYLYIPSIAVGLLLCRFLTTSLIRDRWQRSVQATLLILCAMGAAASVNRNRVWADDLAFWQDVTAKTPDYAYGYRELAQMYLSRNRLDDAEAALKQAVAAKTDLDGRVMTLNNLGNLYLRRQRLDQAEQAFRDGLAIHEHEFLHNGLGRLAMKRAELAQTHGDSTEAQRQVRLAREQLERCIALAQNEQK